MSVALYDGEKYCKIFGIWDIVSSEKTLLEGSYDDGVRSVAKNLLSLHVPIETFIAATGLSKEEIETLMK